MTTKFGWCLTTQHPICRKSFPKDDGSEQRCGCSCHTEVPS